MFFRMIEMIRHEFPLLKTNCPYKQKYNNWIIPLEYELFILFK